VLGCAQTEQAIKAKQAQIRSCVVNNPLPLELDQHFGDNRPGGHHEVGEFLVGDSYVDKMAMSTTPPLIFLLLTATRFIRSRCKKERLDRRMNTALLLVDVINDLVFPEGEQLLAAALPTAKSINRLKAAATRREIPIIYANDNFGHWRSDFRAQVEHCLHDNVPGRAVAKDVTPGQDDYFVLKPMHSGFYGTALELLLRHLDVRRLILCGMATNICVFFTASDAYMRGFELWIPADCVAANSEQLSTEALSVMQTVLKADVRSSMERGLDDWDDPTSGTVKHDRLLKES